MTSSACRQTRGCTPTGSPRPAALAAVPDLYSWDRKVRCLLTTFRDIGAPWVAFDDIDTVRS
jgi:hypothetical protein